MFYTAQTKIQDKDKTYRTKRQHLTEDQVDGVRTNARAATPDGATLTIKVTEER